MPQTHLIVSAAIIFNDERSRILISQRPPGGPHGKLWEFPGGKLEPGETPEDCLHREIHEELGITLSHLVPYLTVSHTYSAFHLTLHAFTALIGSGTPRPLACLDLKWIPLGALPHFPFPEADREIITQLLRDFQPRPKVFPLSDILDLHTFRPEEIDPLLTDYLELCRMSGIRQVRIIHGKGTGTLKRIVHGILKRTSWIHRFHDAPETAGGWGATVVELDVTEPPSPNEQ